jgi:hypothetical protein
VRLGDRFDLLQGCASLREVSVVEKFRAMKMPPLQDERKRSPLHLAAHASVGDPHRDVGAGIPRVKMGRVVRAVVDRDNDSEEASDLGQAILATKEHGRLVNEIDLLRRRAASVHAAVPCLPLFKRHETGRHPPTTSLAWHN